MESMSAILMGLLVVGGTVLFAICALATARRLSRHHIASSHNEAMIALYAGASVTYAVLLGFMVVVVWQAYDDAHRNLAEESASLVALYRLTYGLEAKEGTQMRALVRGYTSAVITDEWPTFGKAEAGSNKTRKIIGDIDRLFATMDAQAKAADAQVDAEILRTKSVIVADRNIRLIEASDSIPWVIWLGAFGGALIIIVMSCFISTEHAVPHFLMSGMMASLIGLLLYIVIALSQPFTGVLPLSPKHFEQALAVMDDVDRGD
jgi:hypothetical protein